jgi:DNA-binding NarL/FixJ family response regulator
MTSTAGLPQIDTAVRRGPNRPLRVLMVDDHAMLRDILAIALGRQPDMEVVGTASSGREALEFLASLRPDVVLLDVSMPDGGGPETAQAIAEMSPEVAVLALSRHEDPAYLRRMMRSGARGYIAKRASLVELLEAIRTVALGRTFVAPNLRGGASEAADVDAEPTPPATRPLSEREEEVLRLIAWGYSSREVADRLGVGVKTVEFYKANGLGKLGLRSRIHLVRHALAESWIGGDDALR